MDSYVWFVASALFFTVLKGTECTVITPAPRPCVDATIINCDTPGICNDAQFASSLCPVTCGHCTNLIADCSMTESPYCATHVNVCRDIELAVLMCPITCGFCPGVVPAPTTPAPVQATTDDNNNIGTTEWPFHCPVCTDAIHTDDCLKSTQTCAKNHVCKGTIDDWKLSFMCASPLICGFEELQGNRNCTSGNAFGPHEHCTFCCQGDECIDDMKHVQHGLDTIPLVLHCPTCADEGNPSVCAHRIVPCQEGENTCQVTNANGRFTSGCAKQDECRAVATDRRCRPEITGSCTWCCSGSTCLTDALGINLSTDAPGASPTNAACHDSDFYPCSLAKDVACNDDGMALTVCPVTCNRCDDFLQQQQQS